MRYQIFLFGLCLFAAHAMAAPQVRFVLATNDGNGIDSSLQDVAGSLSVLKFSKFSVVDSKSVTPGKRVNLSHGYALTCDGESGSYQVTVEKGGERVMNTNISISSQRPLILGGFPHKTGRLILVLKER